ncbi:hypothetical protein M569_10654, partial [Genlisea aurea]
MAMASACVNVIEMPSESLFDGGGAGKYQACGWLSPMISRGREIAEEEAERGGGGGGGGGDTRSAKKNQEIDAAEDDESGRKKAEEPDPDYREGDFADFEFRLEDPVKMLAADELFSDGKLVPLHLAAFRQSIANVSESSGVGSAGGPIFRRINEMPQSTDPYLFSPKAPRCSSRWKELLGLKKLYQNSNVKAEDPRSVPAAALSSHSSRSSEGSLKQFLHRSSKSSLSNPSTSYYSSLDLPLLKDADLETLSISARLSLSSSSSGHEHDDLPRLSLDSEKPSVIARRSHHKTRNPSKGRVLKPRTAAAPSEKSTVPSRAGRSSLRRTLESSSTIPVSGGVSADSPRINSSGKIVFHGLERSSSSPSTLNGGPRHKHRVGMERSYSANVRITPVLNVPVCSLRGSSKSGVFGFSLFQSSQHKKE